MSRKRNNHSNNKNNKGSSHQASDNINRQRKNKSSKYRKNDPKNSSIGMKEGESSEDPSKKPAVNMRPGEDVVKTADIKGQQITEVQGVESAYVKVSSNEISQELQEENQKENKTNINKVKQENQDTTDQISFKDLLPKLLPKPKSIKSAISFLTLLSIVGSIITLICSSYVAERFSKYYGIQSYNLNILTITKNLIVAVIPLVLLLFIARYIFSCLFSSCLGVLNRHKEISIAIIGSLLFFMFTLFYSSWLVGYQLTDSSDFCSVIIQYGLLFLPFVFFPAFAIPRRFEKIRIGASIILASLVLVLCGLFFLDSIAKFRTIADPLEIKSYEIATIDGNTYAIVYTANERKIAMKCEINDKANSLRIYYGKYRYIQCEDYEFNYHTFYTVWVE